MDVPVRSHLSPLSDDQVARKRLDAEILAMRAELEAIQARAQLQNSRNNLEDVLHAPLSGPELALANTMPSIVAGAAGSLSETPR